jgi:hypothetical protein
MQLEPTETARFSLAARSWEAWAFLAIASVAVVVALTVLIAYMRSPILDMHGFRQTQTAISAYWMMHGGGIIDYQTPVTGYPWTIPFEAPVYQASVVAVNVVLPIGLDAAGRLTSFAYLIGAVWIGVRLLSELVPTGRHTGLIFVSLVLLSPQYLYWGRSFLVETTAVFFGALLLFGLIKFYRSGGYRYFSILFAASILCALAKSTTWPGFAAAAGLFWVSEVVVSRQVHWVRTSLLFLVAASSIAAALGWNAFADMEKAKGAFGAALTSANLSDWNFGSLEDRTGPRLWGDVLPTRILPAAFGVFWPVVLIALTHVGSMSQGIWTALAAAVAFFVPLMLFTNLHLVHNYYQTANTIFLLASFACVLGVLVERGKPVIAVLALGIVAGGQWLEFDRSYKPTLDQPLRQAPTYVAGTAAKRLVPQGRSLYVFGADWSSEVHYYAERKGIAFATWFDPVKIRKAMEATAEFVGDQPLGGIVDCRAIMLKYDAALTHDIDVYLKTMAARPGSRVYDLQGGCRLITLEPPA